MISSRIRGTYRTLFAAGLILASGLPAFGQAPPPPPPYPVPQATGVPRTLPGDDRQPSRETRSDETGFALGTAPKTPTQIPAAPGIMGRRGAAGVSVSSLGDTEGPPAGTLDATNGGLGSDLWAGSSRADVEALMGRLPIATTIVSMRTLARRIVLTRAAAPVGAASQAFTTVRLRSLLGAGLLDDAADLAAMAQVRNDPAFARVQAEAILFAGDQDHVCDDTTATRLNNSEAFWIELRAYCYAIGGDEAALALTRSVMDAQNIDNGAFDTLLDDIQNKASQNPGDIEAPTALHLFLLRQTGMPVSFHVGARLGVPGLLLAFRSQQNSPEDRLKAAERLLPSGALSAQELIAIADAQPFTVDQFATEHAQVQQLPFLAGQALLRQAAIKALPDARPALIYEALTTAEAKNMLGIAAVLRQNALGTLTPQPAMRPMAGLMGHALMLTGHADAASHWADLLNPAMASDKPLLARFQIELNLIAPDAARQAHAQSGLEELAQEAASQTPDQAFAVLALGLYAALGEAMPDAARSQSATAMQQNLPGRRPAASLLTRLDQAARAPERKGEALMLVLNAIGAGGPGDLAPDVTVGLVRTLIRQGEAEVARNIAITALLRYRPALPPALPPAQ